METIQTNNLSFYNDQGILTLNAKQYDTGRKFVFYILDNDEPFDLTGCSVYLRMLKADGTQFQGEECCIIDNNTVTIDTSVSNGNQILTAEGQNQCELHLTDQDGNMLTTWEFIIHVQKRVHNGNNIVSTDSWDLMDYIENTAKDFNEKLDNHYFVLTMDKDTAGGVPSLDADSKVPLDELYEATTTSKGITQLTDSITSTSTTTAATPNSVKTAYDKLDNSKAPLASPTLTGTPMAPTAPTGTNTTQIATTAFVQTAVSNGIAASDAMIIKGTIGAAGTVTALPTTYKTGWTYRVVSAGTYAGQVCEIGDLVIALTDRESSDNADSDWCVAQTNINGAITGIKGGDAFIQTSQSGSVVTITHKDVARTDTASTASPSYGGTFTSVDSITSDSTGHITKVNTKTVTLPTYTHPTTAGNKHIPSGGSSGQILKWSADGTAVWGDASDLDTAVTGVKGNAETEYRTGNVNLTAEDIGAVSKTGDTMTGNLHLNYDLTVLGNLNGQKNSTNHSIILGHNQKDYCDFYEYGGVFNFYKGNKTSNTLLGKITENGWEGKASQDGDGNVIADTYLPLSGGTITGKLNVDNSLQVKNVFSVTGGVILGCKNTAQDTPGDGYMLDIDQIQDYVYISYVTNSTVNEAGQWSYSNKEGFTLDPIYGSIWADNSGDLGRSQNKWSAVYAVNGTIQTSDRNAKNTIEELSAEKAQSLIYGLKPSTYKMNSGTSNRTHWGMISQDIEELLEDLEMTSLDFAGFIKSPRIKETKVITDENGNKTKVNEYIEGEYDYSLRYDEFIAPIVKVLQAQHEKIELLEQRVSALEL